MRVIAGMYRGRKLESFEGMDIRPTSDRVKESLFNIINDKLVNCSFLDLFGGSGNVGIEAISRGAGQVVFVDLSSKSIRVIKGNLELLKIQKDYEIYNTDYETAINKLGNDQRSFNIIFIDPPYCKGIEEGILELINKNNILAEDGSIIIEHNAVDVMPEKVGNIQLVREKKYGGTKLSFYEYI